MDNFSLLIIFLSLARTVLADCPAIQSSPATKGALLSDPFRTRTYCGAASDELVLISKVKDAIENGKSLMVGKIGATEYNYVHGWFTAKQSKKFYPGVGKPHFSIDILVVTGVFPITSEFFNRWAEFYFGIIHNFDFVVKWTPEMRDKSVNHNLYSNSTAYSSDHLETLWPWFWLHPYSQYFENKTVLVISPFSKYVEDQYHNKRNCIHGNNPVLTNFTIKTLQAPLLPFFEDKQKYTDPKTFEGRTWFDNLKNMTAAMSNTTYDIVLIGAGAYGIALGTYAKVIQGKIAIILGGNLGPMFGLKGGRFNVRVQYSKYYYNQCWIDMEKPAIAKYMENSAYWRE
jgi:hypothetical protein